MQTATFRYHARPLRGRRACGPPRARQGGRGPGMSERRPLHPDTRLVHEGRARRDTGGAVSVPPYRSSTVLFETVAQFRDRSGLDEQFRYARLGTPTSRALEAAYADLEGADGAVVTNSGLAAASIALHAFLRPGDHLLLSEGSYEPTVSFAREVLAARGVDVELYPARIGAGIAELVRPETRVLFTESPSSLTFELQDLPAMVAAARAHEAPERPLAVIHDNTWATGLLHRPLALGADVVVQAATKYIVGHSDAMLGLIACNARTLKTVRREARLFGLSASPDDCWLGLRGLRTRRVRLARHHPNALALGRWLAERPEVAEVIHPGLPAHPDHALWRRDFDGASGLFALRLQPRHDDAAMCRMLDGLHLFGMGFSFGAFESLLVPVKVPAWRRRQPPPGIVLRLHAGLEEAAERIADLEAGFSRLCQ